MFQIDARSRAVIDQRLRRSPLFRAGGPAAAAGGGAARPAGDDAAQTTAEPRSENASENTDANAGAAEPRSENASEKTDADAGARAGEPGRTLMHEHAYLFSAMTLYCIYPPMPADSPPKSSSVYPAKCSDESVWSSRACRGLSVLAFVVL